jgi:hypothetical protein
MITFIDDHREDYGVEPICKVLPIAPSIYYEQKARQADPSRLPQWAVRDADLREQIERVWKENKAVYGAYKVWRQLNREEISVARCTVERLTQTPYSGAAHSSQIPTLRLDSFHWTCHSLRRFLLLPCIGHVSTRFLERVIVRS